MNPEDPRHGTVNGYNRIPCREDCCRSAYGAWRKRRDWDLRNGRPRRSSTLGTRRRVQALARLGWSQAEVARRAGINPEHMPTMLRKATLRTQSADRIAQVYESLSMALPPFSQSVSVARNIAERNGWPPPLAWPEGRIDDPNYYPRGWQYSPATRAETFTELVERGAGVSELCRHLGLTRAALQKWAANNGLSAEFRAACGREHNYSTSANGGAA